MNETTSTVHYDPTRAAFGFAPPQYGDHSNFDRAREAEKRANWRFEHAATQLADAVVGDYLDVDRDRWVDAYRKAKAAKRYAEAVYEAEAARVRAA